MAAVLTNRRWWATRPTTAERGMVTVETAVVLPVLVALVTALVWLVSLGITQVRCADAAREAARAAARGDEPADVRALAQRAAPDGAVVRVESSDGLVTAVVSVRAGPGLPLLGDIAAVDLTAEAVALEESDASTG